MQVSGSMTLFFNKGATVVSNCIMKLIQAHNVIPMDFHRTNVSRTIRSVPNTGMRTVFAGELARQDAASQQKLRAISQRPNEEIAG